MIARTLLPQPVVQNDDADRLRHVLIIFAGFHRSGNHLRRVKLNAIVDLACGLHLDFHIDLTTGAGGYAHVEDAMLVVFILLVQVRVGNGKVNEFLRRQVEGCLKESGQRSDMGRIAKKLLEDKVVFWRQNA